VPAGAGFFHRVVVPTPFKVGPANVYVFTDGPVTLIDCGPNTWAAENALRLGLAEHGLHLEQIARVIVTHAHPDHYGLAPRIHDISGAEVFVGEHDLPKISGTREMYATGALLMEAGIPLDELVGWAKDAPRDLDPKMEELTPVRPGDRFEFGGFALEALHLPGHTSGHICMLEPERRVLFAGDTLISHITPNPILEPTPEDPTVRRKSLIEYIRSLDVLLSLDLAEVWPGHGEPIFDPSGLISEIEEHHRQRKEEVAVLLDGDGEGDGEEHSAWELARRMFPGLEGFDNYLGVSEVVAHLDLLEEEGRATSFERDGVVYFRGTAKGPSRESGGFPTTEATDTG
jgi:glyoxylase-like metal-dependent hydrolase (beta-lactamase superfamily II)